MFEQKVLGGIPVFAESKIFGEAPVFSPQYDPPTPPEPTPFDRQLPDPDGMDDYETTFPTIVEGGVIIGIAGKNNADVLLDFTVTVNDVPVNVLAFSGGSRERNSFCYIAAVEDLPIGTHTIKITMNGASSAGTAALRIIETDPLPLNWLGSKNATYGSGTSNGVSTSLSNTQVGSTVITMVAWNDYRAYEPSCSMNVSGQYVKQPTIRADLIRDTVTCGFFRPVSVGTSTSLGLSAANPSANWSIALAELRGVTLRP